MKLVEDLQALRRMRCGFCEGTGWRKRTRGAPVKCPICKGDGRGTFLVENLP